ncbi:MAG TPA: ATP-binding protein [Blastocatellia bacterium]|nr:ATP-binding protein [Blastocatellia bacterium]
MTTDSMKASPSLSVEKWLPGGGEMGARIRAFDWASHPLGPIEDWPQSLKIAVRIMLTSRYAMWMGWGPEFCFFCNDAYLPTVGIKESWVLGASARRVWAEIWPDIGPRAESVVATGNATWDESLLLFLERSGYAEETYHTFSYSPIADDDGSIGGMLCVVTEETERVIGERRMALLRELAADLTRTNSEEELFNVVRQHLSENNKDLPFTLIYLFSPDGGQAHLACTQGTRPGEDIAPPVIALDQADAAWPAREILASAEAVTVTDLAGRFATLPTGPWDKPARQAVIVPIAQQGQEQPAGFLIAGINPYRPLDTPYTGFISLLAGQIGSALSNARAYEQERRRAEALAEIDRAKTAFFSNVSHEFRTPLTLMLGPLEDTLAEADELRPQTREQIEIAQRNGLRLLKLVNTLLDFSRIEAGRVDAVYEPTDLATLTAELASVFRSATEKAGLKLIVNCPPLDEPVWVDREMWEKIVLNLISNAFKFTFEGEIEVSLREAGRTVELSVRDTGTGIPEAELPHIFERFHRVRNARGRSFEGSGIGLALVRELVRLHGGEVSVKSRPDQGSTFTVSLPLGKSHLPAERIGAERRLVSTALRADAFAEEALRWLPGESVVRSPLSVVSDLAAPGVATDNGLRTTDYGRILLADDNADMREYVRRLLVQQGCEVIAVADGQAALEAARERLPDLVLTDVMMPHMDGFGLLRELRADERTRELPVIMLSARAGEEARVEGLQAGADDYLTKPFAARELMARVESNLKLARLRREAFAREQALRVEAEEAREQLERVLASINDQFIVLDREWRYVYVNERVVQTTGRRREDLLGRKIWELFPDTVGTAFYHELHRAAAEQQPARFEFHYSPWDRWFENRIYPSPEALTILVSDITARRRIEEALRMSESRLRMVVESARDFAIFTMDLDRRVTIWNAGAQHVLGFEESEIIGESGDVIFTPEDRAQRVPESELSRMLSEGRAEDERWHQRRDGSRFWASGVMMPLYDEAGQLRGLLKILRDRTEQRLAEEERERLLAREQELRRAAEEASRLKDEFLATVSHELRTPLNHMLGWVVMLRSGRLAPDQAAEALATIERNARAQNRLIEDLLDVSRIITGRLRLDLQPVAIAQVVEAAVASAQPAAAAKGIVLVNDADPASGTVRGDADRLQQVVWNLLSNAIRFTPAGGSVIVRLAREDTQVRLTVSDTGEGISPEFLPFVFDRFSQADGSYRRKHGGLGLGLAIVRHLVELHGGEVSVESAGPGCGATFTVTLPLRDAEGGTRNEEVSAPVPIRLQHPAIADGTLRLSTVKALVVDDEEDTRKFVAALLTESGATVRTAAGAAEAEAVLSGWMPDVIVADIGMPGEDGYEFIQRVRKREAESGARKTPAIALTAYARPEDRLNALAAGYQQHLPKPVEPAELLVVVASLTGQFSPRKEAV